LQNTLQAAVFFCCTPPANGQMRKSCVYQSAALERTKLDCIAFQVFGRKDFNLADIAVGIKSIQE